MIITVPQREAEMRGFVPVELVAKADLGFKEDQYTFTVTETRSKMIVCVCNSPRWFRPAYRSAKRAPSQANTAAAAAVLKRGFELHLTASVSFPTYDSHEALKHSRRASWHKYYHCFLGLPALVRG